MKQQRYKKYDDMFKDMGKAAKTFDKTVAHHSNKRPSSSKSKTSNKTNETSEGNILFGIIGSFILCAALFISIHWKGVLIAIGIIAIIAIAIYVVKHKLNK